MEEKVNVYHIDILDGIRVMAVMIVMWLHFWQLSFLMPIGFGINLDWIPRTGWMMVDMLILLSGFCLFLPHARSMLIEEAIPDTKMFYKKRVARIFPSYYICILIVLFIFAIPLGEYSSKKHMSDDIFAHLTFTHNMFFNSHYFTKLNGVLWTLAIEVQFYILFPLVAKFFRKKPFLTYSVMVAASIVFHWFIVKRYDNSQLAFRLSWLPSFLGVYANGMMGALIFVAIAKKKTREKYEGIFYTAVAVFCMYLYKVFMLDVCAAVDLEVWKAEHRFVMSILFVLFIISCAFALKGFRFLFSNKVVRFLSGISFNWYIWHQLIGAKLKEFHIPYWTGEEAPNITGDKVWMWKYFILIWVVSFAVAVFMTYIVEKPIAKWIMKKGNEKCL